MQQVRNEGLLKRGEKCLFDDARHEQSQINQSIQLFSEKKVYMEISFRIHLTHFYR